MEEANTRCQRISDAINETFKSPLSVKSWCRMCRHLSDLLMVATQLGNADVHDSVLFCKAIGYLTMKPKQAPRGMVCNEDEWSKVSNYTAEEVRTMSAALHAVDERLAEWAVSFGADEDHRFKDCKDLPFPRQYWLFREAFPHGVSVFKTSLGRTKFTPFALERLAEMMTKKPIFPSSDQEEAPPVAGDSSRRSDKLEKAVVDSAKCLRILAGEAICDGQARARVGTDDEILQENEVVRRVNANGGRGLRGFVAQVLREEKWQLRGGHANTEAGRQRCYNRVYAMLKPRQRSKRR